MSTYRLCYLNHEVELPSGEFAIGRGSKCQLIISDPQVSRRHAILHVRADHLAIEDLGSRNATLVNGVVVRGRVSLIGGDRIQIGRHEIIVVRSKIEDSRDEVPTDGRAPAPWFSKSVQVSPPPPTDESTEPSALLADLAQKALSAGNTEEAEWILSKLLAEFHYRASGGDKPSPAALDKVVSHALRLAQLTGKIVFLDGLFDVLGTVGHLINADAVTEVEALARRIPELKKGRLPKYVDALQKSPAATDRLVVRLATLVLG